MTRERSPLSRDRQRALKPGESKSAGGITYTKLRGDGRWSVNVMVNRERIHRVVGLESAGFTLAQAEELVAKLTAGKAQRRHGVASKLFGRESFGEAAKLYLAHLKSTGGKSIAWKARLLDQHLVPALGHLKLGTMTSEDLKGYSAKRQQEDTPAKSKTKPATVNREMAVVSHLFRTAARELRLIPSPPCTVPRLKEPEGRTVHLDPAQARALQDAAEGDQNPLLAVFVMIGLHTGMRYTPILRLQVQDVDVERRVLWVDKDKAGARQQPMTAELAAYLKRYLRTLPKDATWLFPSTRSKDGRTVNLYKGYRRAVTAAKLRGVTPHTLRHTMATNAAHAGVDGATLQALGGWKSRRMVERYTHASTLGDAMDKLQAQYRKGRGTTQKLQRPSRRSA